MQSTNDESNAIKIMDYGCDSIPFYNNEFVGETKIPGKTDKNEEHLIVEKGQNNTSKDKKQTAGSSKKNTKSSHLNEQKSAKKRAKKQAWKQKQREQKLMRMKKREEKKSS